MAAAISGSSRARVARSAAAAESGSSSPNYGASAGRRHEIGRVSVGESEKGVGEPPTWYPLGREGGGRAAWSASGWVTSRVVP